MNICTRCSYDYPEDVELNRVGGALHRGVVCGICALEMINAVHGRRRQQFGDGTQAEQVRLDAIEARRNGTAKAPRQDAYQPEGKP